MTIAYESGQVPEIEVRHRLRIAREFAGLDQEQLAALMGVARNTVVNAETGRRRTRKIVINAWALACGVPVSWIETGIGTPQQPSPDGGGGDRADNPSELGFRTQQTVGQLVAA